LAVVYLGLAGLAGGIERGDEMVTRRYWATVDNQFPGMVTHRLVHGLKLSGELVPGWRSSDRPPLQSGMALSLSPVAGESRATTLILGVALQAFWVMGLWAVLRAIGAPGPRATLTVIAVGSLGAVFLNTVFTWPKMLSGAFTLVAVAVLLERQEGSRRHAVLVGTNLAFAFLAH